MRIRVLFIRLILISTAVITCGLSGAEELEADPFTLKQCAAYALQNSFEIKLARLDLLIAETDIMYSQAVFDTLLFGKIGYSKDKRALISAIAGENRQLNSYEFGLGKTLPTGTKLKMAMTDERQWVNSPFVTTNPAHSAEMRMDLEQPVMRNFFGQVDRGRVTLSQLAVENAGLRLQESIEELAARTEEAYWELVYAQNVLRYNQRLKEKAEKLYETNKRNLDLGLIERPELIAAEANVNVRKSTLRKAQNDLRKAEEALKLTMNIDPNITLAPAEGFPASRESYDVQNCLRQAFENRRDYAAAERQIEIRQLDLKLKENMKWPELDLKASLAVNGVDKSFTDAAGGAGDFSDAFYFLGAEFRFPLENRKARSDADEAAYRKQQALFFLKATEREIITEVANAVRDHRTYQQVLADLEKSRSLQAEKLRLEEKRFRGGRSSTKTLIDYQQDLLRSEVEEAAAKRAIAKSRTRLYRAMNTLLAGYEEFL